MRHSFQSFMMQEDIIDDILADVKDIIDNQDPLESVKGDFGFFDVTMNDDWDAYGTSQVPGFEENLRVAGLKKEDLKRALKIEFRPYQKERGKLGKQWDPSEKEKMEKLEADYFGKEGNENKTPDDFEAYRNKRAALETMKLYQKQIVPNLKRGDVMYNEPLPNKDGLELGYGVDKDKADPKGNWRASFYKGYGFGDLQPAETNVQTRKKPHQHGVVNQDAPQNAKTAVKPIGGDQLNLQKNTSFNHDD